MTTTKHDGKAEIRLYASGGRKGTVFGPRYHPMWRSRTAPDFECHDCAIVLEGERIELGESKLLPIVFAARDTWKDLWLGQTYDLLESDAESRAVGEATIMSLGASDMDWLDRETLLLALAVGDIFHAECPSGASLICLTTSVTDAYIEARTVTTQRQLRFIRRTGIEWGGVDPIARIDSVEPLPVDIHNVMLGLDRKFRLIHRVEHIRLNDAEKKALLFVASFYPANPLPEAKVT